MWIDVRYNLGLVYICRRRRAITSSAIFRTVLGTSYVRAMVYVYIIHDYRAIFCADSRGTDQDKSVRRLRGDCTAIVQFQCSHRTVSASFLWDRTEPVQLPCRGCTEIRSQWRCWPSPGTWMARFWCMIWSRHAIPGSIPASGCRSAQGW